MKDLPWYFYALRDIWDKKYNIIYNIISLFWTWLEELAESVYFIYLFIRFFIILLICAMYWLILYFPPQEWFPWRIIFTCTLHIFCSNIVFCVIRRFYRIYIAESWVYRAVLWYIFSTFLLNKALSLITVVSDWLQSKEYTRIYFVIRDLILGQ